jgi:signal transduction histidine kinase/CheY-like chemotaxis protein
MSLLTRLFALVLLAVLPAIGILAYDALELRRVRDAESREEALRLARLADAEMERLAEGTRQLLVSFAENPAVAAGKWQDCDAAAARVLARLSGYVDIGAATTGGEVVCSGLARGNGAGLASPPISGIMPGADFAIGTYEIHGGVKTLPFTEPLLNAAQQKIGVVWARLDLDWLARHFAGRFTTPEITLAIADRDGTLLLRLPDPKTWVGRQLDRKYAPMLEATAEGVAEIDGVDGVWRIIGYSPLTIEPRGLYVGVGLEESSFLAQINHATIRGGVLVALCLCLALAAAWAGGTLFIRRPVRALLAAAERWRQGDYGARAEISDQRSEIGRLGRAFDQMAAEIAQRADERHRAEAALRRLSETLEQRVAERTAALVEANRRLAVESEERRRAEAELQQAQKIESIGQLTGGIAHDFNNLLTAVLGNLEVAQGRVKDEALLRLLSGASRAAERGARLTQQLLAFSRRQHLQRRVLDLNEIVRGMSDMLHRSIGATVRVDQHLAPDLWPATTDPNQIELAILNLAINARDAMPVGGSLLIETMNSPPGDPHRPAELGGGDYVAIAVSDTGTGMSEEVMARALEPFFTTKERGKGSGLGLSMVYGVARQSGGGLALSSRLGEGTTVRVYLPRAQETAAASDQRAQETIEAAGLAGRSVLLIDDDPDVRQVTATLLAELGCRVIGAESGRAGLAALARCGDIDVAVIDFAMPGLNGLEAAALLVSRCPDLPIVIVTGYADMDLSAAERHGFRLLRKPFQRAEIADTLRGAIGCDANSRQNVVPLRRSDGAGP